MFVVCGRCVKSCIHEYAKWFANQMHVCVNGTANLLCAICEWFAYLSPQTEIGRPFARAQRELDVPDVLSIQRVSFARLRFVEN